MLLHELKAAADKNVDICNLNKGVGCKGIKQQTIGFPKLL